MRSVDGIDLRVPRHSIYGFLGPNGAGKTTSIRMLLGLIRPTSGRVSILDRDLSRQRLQILRRVGALVESPSYYPHLTGYENLGILATILELPKGRVDEVLKLVRLEGAAGRLVGGYSLGMKQRLGIAAALLNRPELVVLDEPTNGLDPGGIQEVRTLIRSLPEEHGVTVFVSSHLLGEVEQIATDVGIIHQGRLIFQGAMDELRRQREARAVFEVDETRRALEILRGFDPACRAEGDRIVMGYRSKQEVARANRELVLAGCAVSALGLEQPSLESLFLSLTGTEVSL